MKRTYQYLSIHTILFFKNIIIYWTIESVMIESYMTPTTIHPSKIGFKKKGQYFLQNIFKQFTTEYV